MLLVREVLMLHAPAVLHVPAVLHAPAAQIATHALLHTHCTHALYTRIVRCYVRCYLRLARPPGYIIPSKPVSVSQNHPFLVHQNHDGQLDEREMEVCSIEHKHV
jgi:hypothetical protein